MKITDEKREEGRRGESTRVRENMMRVM